MERVSINQKFVIGKFTRTFPDKIYHSLDEVHYWSKKIDNFIQNHFASDWNE